MTLARAPSLTRLCRMCVTWLGKSQPSAVTLTSS